MELNKLNRHLPAAAGRLANMPKVTPEMMMIVYLDEIAGRLAELQDTLSDFMAEGNLNSSIYSVTDNPVKIPTVCSNLSLHNDGANFAYLLSDKGKPMSEAPIRSGGDLSLDFKTKKLRIFYLVCNSGETASVRVFTW